jgi:hypothetical protein
MYHQTLNLPSPLKPEMIEKIHSLKNTSSEYFELYTSIDKFLSPDLLAALSTVDLFPDHFIIFGRKNKKIQHTRLHSDLVLCNNQWVDVPMAINWELTPGISHWNWWDTTTRTKIYPEIDDSCLHSTTTVTRPLVFSNQDPYNTSDLNCLESCAMFHNQAVLVRADVAHQVSYISAVDTRMCLSLRFLPTQVGTWDNAVNQLKPLFI